MSNALAKSDCHLTQLRTQLTRRLRSLVGSDLHGIHEPNAQETLRRRGNEGAMLFLRWTASGVLACWGWIGLSMPLFCS